MLPADRAHFSNRSFLCGHLAVLAPTDEFLKAIHVKDVLARVQLYHGLVLHPTSSTRSGTVCRPTQANWASVSFVELYNFAMPKLSPYISNVTYVQFTASPYAVLVLSTQSLR